MEALNLWATLLVRLPGLAAHAVGVVVGAVLVARRRDAAAWLALVGFGVMLAVGVGSWLTSILPLWAIARGASARLATVAGIVSLLGLLLNLGAALGALCLAAALWIGLRDNAT
jgi:hypothetical protein